MRKTFTIALLLSILAGCSQQGPLSPRQTLSALQKAYKEQDVTLFLTLITAGSKQTLTTNTDIFNELAPETKKEIFTKAGVSFNENIPLSVDQYIELYFACNHRIEKDIVARALEGRIVAVDESEKSVIFTMDTELDLQFRLEAPYWKFDYASVYE